jgi:hypothetical protein
MKSNTHRFLAVLALFIYSFSFAQDDKGKKAEKTTASDSKTTSVQQSTSQKEIKPGGLAPVAEPNPTPEQQGFTKYTVDGVEYYHKQEGQLQINYKPKSN